MQFNTISHIQTRKYDAIGGKFFDSDMIAAAYDKGAPHVFDRIMGQVFSSTDMFNGKPLLGMTLAKGKMMEIETDVYRWRLVGAQEKALRSVEVLDGLDAAGATPGLGKQPFRIKLDEGWYSHPDVIEPQHDDYKLAILEGPIQDGNGYIYTVELQTDSYTKFLPQDLLEPGKEFTKVWTTVPNEMNEWFGTMQFGSSFELECQVGAFANEFIVTDRMMREDNRMIGMEIPYRDKDTGKVKFAEKFISVAQAKLEDQLYKDMEYQMWKGEKTTGVGPNGYFTRTGPGIRQQLRDGHTHYYNGALTETLLEDYLDGIFFSRVTQGQRKITAMTGSMGAIAFHNMLASSASQYLTVDTNYIQRVGKGGVRHLSYGAQFVHYQGLNGIEVDLIINPLYDDVHFCKRTHPDQPSKPIDSWRMTFLDFGTDDMGEDNIQMLTVKDTRQWGYLEGTIDHTGKPIKGGSLRSKVAGCEYISQGTAGIWVKDVSRCGELIFDPEY